MLHDGPLVVGREMNRDIATPRNIATRKQLAAIRSDLIAHDWDIDKLLFGNNIIIFIECCYIDGQ